MAIGIVNSQFTPKTELWLYEGVPIDAVNNTFWGCFTNKTNQKEFFDNNYKHKTYKDYTYQRRNGVVNIEANYDDMRNYNYMIYKNGESGNKSKWIYCFINEVGYVSDEVTSVDFETDVIQTYRFEIEANFDTSFISFEHRARYYLDNGTKRPCINTQNENIELGTDMVAYTVNPLLRVDEENISYAVITMTSTFDGVDTATTLSGGVPTQYSYYIVPFNTSTGAGFFDDMNITCNMSDGSSSAVSPIRRVYDLIRKSSELVNKCVSISICQSLPMVNSVNGSVVNFNHSTYKLQSYTVEDVGETIRIIRFSGYRLASLRGNLDISKWETTNEFELTSLFPQFEETRLLYYPFSYTEIIDNNGTIKAYKNELWKDKKVNFVCLGSVDTSQVEYIPKNYKIRNGDNFLLGDVDSTVSGYQMNLPVISDYTAALMQSSSNAMNANVANTVRSNEASLAIASATNAANSSQTAIQNSLSSTTTANNNKLASTLMTYQNYATIGHAAVSVASQAIQGAASAVTNPFGYALGGGLVSTMTGVGETVGNAAIDVALNTYSTNASNATSLANTNAANNANTQSTAIGNKLRTLTTNYQNNVNLQNALASYHAKIYDAQATADSIVSGGSNLLRIFSVGLNAPLIISYVPREEYWQRASKIFKVRGYATNQYKKPNLHTRKNWNYIQTVKCNIKHDGIDSQDFEKIRTAFDNGITLWHTADVFNYDNNNDEIIDISKANEDGSYKE